MAINPTRMNLINTRKSIAIAKKGHDLLDNKKQVLVREFLTLLKESSKGREHLQGVMQSAYRTLAIGIAYVGDLELERIAAAVREPEPVKIAQKNIMGVHIPEIERSKVYARVQERGYGLVGTSMAADDAHDSFVQALDAIVDVAKREQGLKRLIIAIEKAKRQVNALEYVRIPALNRQAKYVSMRLDEIERDNFSALKHVKKRLRSAEEE